MYHADVSLKIAQEQREKTAAAIESAAVTLFGVVTGALVPQMVYQYMLSGGELVEPPAFLQYIPHIGYGVAALFFVNMLVGNYFRSRRIKAYRQELELMSLDDCQCEECLTEDDEATNSLAEVMAKSESKTKAKKAPAKKKTVKKSVKKSTK